MEEDFHAHITARILKKFKEVLSNIVRKQYPPEVWNIPFRAICKKPRAAVCFISRLNHQRIVAVYPAPYRRIVSRVTVQQGRLHQLPGRKGEVVTFRLLLKINF